MKTFSIGDKVKVTGYQKGILEMEKYVGRKARIMELASSGWATLDVDDGDWSWNPDWLSPLKVKKERLVLTKAKRTLKNLTGSFQVALKEFKRLEKPRNKPNPTRRKGKVELPRFSWERPIEEEILQYVQHMAESMEGIASHNLETGWFKNNRLQEDAQKMADAYRTVEKHIIDEIKLRRTLDDTKENNG